MPDEDERWHLGDKLRGRHRQHRRQIRDGDTYTIDEDLAGEIEREERTPDPNPPPEGVRGEPWGWTKGPPYPRGWREDGRYDRESR
jgi:hypothetical protein